MPVATVGPGRQSDRFWQLLGAFACQIKVPELADGGEAEAFSAMFGRTASVNVLVQAHLRASPAPPVREDGADPGGVTKDASSREHSDDHRVSL